MGLPPFFGFPFCIRLFTVRLAVNTQKLDKKTPELDGAFAVAVFV